MNRGCTGRPRVFGEVLLFSSIVIAILLTAPSVTFASTGDVLSVAAMELSAPSDDMPLFSVAGIDYADQTDQRLLYLGPWYTVSDTTAAGGSYAITYKTGAAVVIKFEGTDFAYRLKKAPDYGLVEVTVDGSIDAIIDFGGSSPGYFEYEIATVDSGSHTVAFKCRSGKFAVDAFAALGTIVDLNTTRVQETDPALSFVGPWSEINTWSASGGGYASGTYPGCSVSVEFDGNYIAWYATMLPDYGPQGRAVCQVFLDGVEVSGSSELYSPYPKYKQKVFDSGYLPSGHHTLTIYQWASYGSGLSVDAFDILGALDTAEPAEPILWVYQEKDPRITLLGPWTPIATGSSSGEYAYQSLGAPGGAAYIDFIGTKVEIHGMTAPWCGKGLLSIDGGTEEYVDFYGESAHNGNVVFTKQGLSDGLHHLVLKYSGEKNPLSSGYSISLDYLIMKSYLGDAPRPARYEQDDSDLDYQGPWVRDCPSPYAASGWSYSYADMPGSSTRIEFTGTYLTWVARATPWSGKARVILDAGTENENETTVDTWNSTDLHKQKVYHTGFIEDGAHTLDIYWTGEKNSASWYPRIYTDALDVLGTIQDAGPAPAIEWTYQQDDPRLVTIGAWSTTSDTLASGGSLASTSDTGAAAVAKFNGTEVAPVFCTGPAYGQVRLTLDPGTAGEDVQTVDLYSAAEAWQVTGLYAKTGLADTEHTLVIENASSGGEPVVLDGLRITGYLDQAVTKIDDKDYAHFSYDPGIATAGASTEYWSRWDDSGYWAAYLDTYAYTDQPTYKASFTFDGTYAAWVACTSNTKGKAEVRLYEGSADPGNLLSTEEVDLYSPSTLWKQAVYSTPLLADGTYVIEIECLGTKNWASWWYTINVDRFDILATAP